MTPGQSLARITSRALDGIDSVIERLQPHMVFAQGDTTTTFVAGLAAFYRQVPFGHIEAGLRTDTVHNPFPEEFNRRTLGLFAAQHYAPTEWSADNLRREGVPNGNIFVTGNTGIDAVMHIAEMPGETPWVPEEGRVILMTTHRRENWGEPQAQIARAARRLLGDFPDTHLLVAMHRNPIVRNTLVPLLGDHPRAHLIEPPDYGPFVRLMRRVDLILTDSGGVQEEAPTFGKPVLVLRDTTERPEGVDAGTARLVGTEEAAVYGAAAELLSDPAAYQAMAQAVSPYGDGKASDRIWAAAREFLKLGS
jgi:UDP-N-acetylglucosamine 2-epimerase (non-hydrolysing)